MFIEENHNLLIYGKEKEEEKVEMEEEFQFNDLFLESNRFKQNIEKKEET